MSIVKYFSPGAFIASQVYHRIFPDRGRPKGPGQEIQIPRTDAGAVIPRVFGRVKVRAPILAWASDPYNVDVYLHSRDGDPPQYTTAALALEDDQPSHRVYALDLLYIAGIPMGKGVARGNSLAGPKLHNVWWGNYKLPSSGELPRFSSTIRYGQSVSRLDKFGGMARGGGLRGSYHWFGGWTDQSFDAPPSQVGDRMAAWGANGFGNGIPGLANMMCVSFTTMPEDNANAYFDQTIADPGAPSTFEAQPLPGQGFIFGESPSVQPVSLELSSYGDRLDDVTGKHIFQMQREGTDFGGDADPAEVAYSLLVDCLDVPPSKIDTTSFNKVSTTCKAEALGYSRLIDDGDIGAEDAVGDIMEHIDAALDEDPETGKWVMTLVRPDFDPNTIPHFTKDNSEVRPGKAGSRINLVNAVKVGFENRSKGYESDFVQAKNPGNALGAMPGKNTAFLQRPGCKTVTSAKNIAARELAWRSRPMITLRIFVAREFQRLLRGMPVKVTATDPNISGMIFRIADIDRGETSDGRIALDLVQDVSYVWRGLPPRTSWLIEHIDEIAGVL